MEALPKNDELFYSVHTMNAAHLKYSPEEVGATKLQDSVFSCLVVTSCESK